MSCFWVRYHDLLLGSSVYLIGTASFSCEKVRNELLFQSQSPLASVAMITDEKPFEGVSIFTLLRATG